MREKIVILTRKEIDALTVYSDKARSETINAIFTEVEELLQLRYRFEDKRGNVCEDESERSRHFYGRNVCECLLIDLQMIKRKFNEK